MAAITSCTVEEVSPNSEVKFMMITTPATADSADTVDLTAASNGGAIKVLGIAGASDTTTGDNVTCTIASGTTVTLDAAGGTTNHVYNIFAFVI